MSLYDMLTPVEKAYHDALMKVVSEHGYFDQGTQSVWVGYEMPEDNEKASIGVKCGNCSFYRNDGGCAIVSFKVEENAYCRLAAIPDNLVVKEENEEIDKKAPCWDGYVQRGMKEKDGRMVPNCVPAKKMNDMDDMWKGVFDRDSMMSVMKRDYNTAARRRMAESGAAMPDGSFPIANRTDLENAIRSIGRASNPAAVKEHIKRRARALGLTNMLPEEWK